MFKLSFLLYPPPPPRPPPAIPAGVLLQVDGQAGGADRLRGRQRHLPEADVPAAGLLPPLQRRVHRDQEEEVSGTAPRPDAAGLTGAKARWLPS